MRDLSVLKERIEYAERHLSASHSARERESQALMAMWRQIRDRFESQEQEIARYRTQLADMSKVNDELAALVDRLIASVEGGIADSGSETVPEIARLAGELLQSEPSLATAEPLAPSLPEQMPEPEEILELDTPADPLEEPAGSSEESFSERLEAALAEEFTDDELSIPKSMPVEEDSASEGIRALVSRIENAVTPPGEADQADAKAEAAPEDPELARELDEIESLRNELNGLRNKISAGN